MPQPGEIWRLRPRPTEGYVTPCCEKDIYSIPATDERTGWAEFEPRIVKVVAWSRDYLYGCSVCGYKTAVLPEGIIPVVGLGNEDEGAVVPYTWLEPIVEEAADVHR